MNNNSEQISRYLRDEMTKEERNGFQDRLSTDKELQQELHVQQQIIEAAVNAGIKNEFAKAMRKGRTSNRVIRWGLLAAATVIAIVVINFWHRIFPGKASMEMHPVEASIHPFINPPLAGINVPLSEFILDAEKGDTFVYASGSVICFPPASLVDALGVTVKGKVKVTYREFTDPVDFFVSGIPMAYDSGAVKYNFESVGMCEINASQNDKAVFVNKNAPPQIYLSAKNKDPQQNLYFLDTVNRRWEYMGKDMITEVKSIAQSKPISTTPVSVENESMPVKPVKPARALDDKPSFSIEIVPGAFEELFAYDGLKFQVEDESSYRRSDAEEHWDNMNLERTSSEGIYTIRFTNTRRTVSYKVKPVLEGADYDAALKIFNQKKALYEQALQNRLVKERTTDDSIKMVIKKRSDKMKADQEWNEKLNAMILARNKKLRDIRQQQMIEIQQSEEAREQEEAQKAKATIKQIEEVRTEQTAQQKKAEDEFYQLMRYQAKMALDQQKSAEIVRSFNINSFGVWNCDQPLLNNAVPLSANFTDSLDNSISLSGLAVVYSGFNGIAQFPTPLIRVIPGKRNLIWGVQDRIFYYFTSKDFEGTDIVRNTKTYTFRMRSEGKIISSYKEIRELVGQL